MTPREIAASARARRRRPHAAVPPPRDRHARIPSRRPTVRWGASRFPREACSNQYPRRHGVGVPHLSRAELVAAPHRCGNTRHEVEDLLNDGGVVGEPHGTRHRIREIGDRSARPAPNLVAEHPEPPNPSCADGTFRHHAPFPPSPIVRNGRHLDDEPTLGRVGDECRVVQVATRASLRRGRERLVDPSTDLHDLLPRSQRDPVEVHRPRRCVVPRGGFAPPNSSRQPTSSSSSCS